MACKCIEKLSKQLEKENIALATETLFSFTPGKVSSRTVLPIATRKIMPSRKRLRTVLGAFCPFCGKLVEGKAKPRKKAKAWR